MDGANVYINQCLNEALNTLKRYNTVPFLDNFLDRAGIEKDDLTQKQKLKAIEAKILNPGSALSFKDLSDYVDELKWNGKQHIFLFILKDSNYLERLRDAEFVREQLSGYGCGHLFNKDTRLWEDTEPKLVSVTHTFDRERQEGRLLFKWVETRRFHERIIVNGLNVIMPQRERSVNFFSVNLNDGSAELRLQSLKNRPERPLKELENIYKTEIKKFINLDYFAPVPIDPIIRKFLKKTILPVARWRIQYPETGELKGRNNLSLIDRLRFLFRPFFSREMMIFCECKQHSTGDLQLPFSLHGDSDEIRFNSISDREKVDQILNQLRRFSMELLKMDELKNVAMLHPEYLRIISAIDFLFISLKKSKINAKELSSMVWFPKETIIEVFKIITELYGDKFSLKGKNSDVLIIRICFTIRGGLQECIKRQMDKSKHKEILKPAVTPALVVVFYMILDNLVRQVASWILESMVGRVLPGIPIFLLKGVLALVIAVFLFGAAGVFFKLPKAISNFLWVLLTGLIDTRKLQKKLQGKYNFPGMSVASPNIHIEAPTLLLPPYIFHSGLNTGALVYW